MTAPDTSRPALESALRDAQAPEALCRMVRKLLHGIEQRDELVRWALGEVGEFPNLPDDWPKRKWYWRTELRARWEAIRDGD